ncbi:hypothetical protein [Undibacterium sp. TS12]|uniref:hypothetical protein n=1 Tax=Undibacterium sp. TS12 TaxID=2908202 RepID=UPI001F4C9C08|nr:hypothetical protein [Undibacterium sp. TS12]MCH8619377.1 hypothetical protein [Undibacterium sp. TS12]
MDYTEMQFALEIYEKALAIRNRHLFRTPEPIREQEAKKYTLEIAIREVLAEIKTTAAIIKVNGN